MPWRRWLRISFIGGIGIYGAVIAALLGSAIAVYYWLESRPVSVQPLAVYEAPQEIFEQARDLQGDDSGSSHAALVYGARTFAEARSLIESGTGMASYDGRSLLRASARACEGYDPSLQPEDWRRSLLYPAVEGRGHAMRSLQMVVYFQSVYCDGVQPSPVSSGVGEFLAQIDVLAAETTDQDTLDFISLMTPLWNQGQSEGRDVDLDGFGSLASRTGSPAIFSEALGILMSRSPDSFGVSRHTMLLSGDQEVRRARAVAISLARCEVFDSCPPMGLALMVQCAPYRCPPDGTLRSYYASQYSDSVMEAAEAMKRDIVEWRRQPRN